MPVSTLTESFGETSAEDSLSDDEQAFAQKVRERIEMIEARLLEAINNLAQAQIGLTAQIKLAEQKVTELEQAIKDKNLELDSVKQKLAQCEIDECGKDSQGECYDYEEEFVGGNGLGQSVINIKYRDCRPGENPEDTPLPEAWRE